MVPDDFALDLQKACREELLLNEAARAHGLSDTDVDAMRQVSGTSCTRFTSAEMDRQLVAQVEALSLSESCASSCGGGFSSVSTESDIRSPSSDEGLHMSNTSSSTLKAASSSSSSSPSKSFFGPFLWAKPDRDGDTDGGLGFWHDERDEAGLP